MTEQQFETLRFPIGRWQRPETFSEISVWQDIVTLREFPEKLRKHVERLSDPILDTPYRPEGWTVRQVIHHCADSHMNCLIRFKLALTEDLPTIKPYAEDRWAALPDYKLPIEGSLQMLTLVHARLLAVIAGMEADDWARAYLHPQYGTTFRLDQVASLYAWHCNHHLGHILSVVEPKAT